MIKFTIDDIHLSVMFDFCLECGFPCDFPDLCPYEVRHRMVVIALCMILDGLY